ncbi:MAG: DUF11 domain-containing protein, partial [Verrucomicrobia bacterium]
LPPRIFSFTPTNAPAATTVTITGTNLLGASAVSFGGVTASFTAPSNNATLYATVPVGVVTGPITVTTPGGTTNSTDLFYGPPIITGFNPTSGLAGTNVTITGTNFLNVAAVRFNGLNAIFYPTNIGLLGAIVPAGASTGPISIVTPGGTNFSTSNFVLNYTADLRLTISDAPDPVTVGGNVTYLVTVTNAGPFAAPNLRLTNTLPAGASLTGVGTTLLGSLSTSPSMVIVSVGSLAVGGSGTLTVTVAAPGYVTTLTDQASVRCDYSDPAPADNDVTATTIVEPVARLTISNAPPNLVRVSWPAGLTNFGLEYRASLPATNSWSNYLTTPTTIGDESVITEPHANAARYYRLRRLP